LQPRQWKIGIIKQAHEQIMDRNLLRRNNMQYSQERKAFLRIASASVKNIIGFGLTTALIGYLVKNTDIGTPIMILAGVVVFIMAVSLGSLLMFTGYTINGMPATMASKPENKSFADIYRYILAALAVRMTESAICIVYILYIYYLYF
jgi:hypothetical protein